MTTHIFIVNTNTLKYHLEYLFAGTGAKDKYIDFNNSPNTKFHYATENNLLGMIADISRIRIGDNIIFYLQAESGVEGKFFGIFKIKSLPFLDNNDNKQFLKDKLKKSLTFRVLIEPFEVYADGVTEWEALDEIKNICSPYQMLWSMIYRKLKGNRGNTMITIYEFERLRHLIRNKNNKQTLKSSNFSFDAVDKKIIATNKPNLYEGEKEKIDIFPRLLAKFHKSYQFETHLQAYILQNLESIFTNLKNIEWIGNEVSCGVGMQRIDILISIFNGNNRVLFPIELKSAEAKIGITRQIQRYVDWINQYYLPNRYSDVEPVVISRQIIDKNMTHFKDLIDEFNSFNAKNNLKITYIEFSITNNSIKLKKIDY
ncbi:DUF91 domain-containing protein [Campylobacter ureolyticus]|uniref:DUF91 domain-containing protein n=1 Tax=Campylobacter ureolyticus TaxID=827 RepID=UPI0022B3DF96|nr:DUF91 domain-containing protein [Campylobacter ureolyticus]MCZ6171896.1 DUF91 domain-containing protein [Campylobacter ureolyticus]